MLLPATIAPGLGRHLFLGGLAATRGVTMIIAKNSFLDMGAFTVPLREDSLCSTLDHVDLTTDDTSRTPDTAFPTIFSSTFKRETVPAVHASACT